MKITRELVNSLMLSKQLFCNVSEFFFFKKFQILLVFNQTKSGIFLLYWFFFLLTGRFAKITITRGYSKRKMIFFNNFSRTEFQNIFGRLVLYLFSTFPKKQDLYFSQSSFNSVNFYISTQ
jgi:hypothetical protein